MRFPPIRHPIICFLGFWISESSVDNHKNRSFDASNNYYHILSWYVSELLQMTLPVLSAQSITNQLAFQGPSCSFDASLRLNLKFSDSIGGIGLTNSVFDYHLIRLKLKHKGRVTKNHVIYASQNENGELERGNPKPYTDDDILKSVLLSHGNNLCQEDLDVKALEADPPSNLNINEHVINYPVNQGNLLDRLKAVQLHVLASEQWNASRIKLCHRHYVESATNLIHYLALKCLDVEDLKEELSSVGLLNLETINPYVTASISAGIKMLENLKSISLSSKENMDSIALDHASAENVSTLDGPDKRKKGETTITAMRKKALSHSVFLLGPLRDGKTTHIMVTVGKEAIESDTLINDLLNAGATTMRINCAHGDPSIWSEIIQRIRRSSHLLEKPCRILMDLAGPKLRTCQMKAGPSVMKISPKRNASGSVIVPAQVWLSHKDAGPPPAHLSPDKVLFVDNQEFLSSLEVGDTLRFYDTRGRKRALKISIGFPVFAGIGFMAECMSTAYVESGTTLYIKGKKGRSSVGTVVNVPAVEQFVRLQIGDLLIISRDLSLTTKTESEGSTVGAPRITCPSSYLFDSVKPGERIAFDDGKIWGVIQGTSSSEIVVSITHAGLKGSKLGSEKSINIPESEIRFEGLTSKDIVDLEFVAEHADMVGISFIRDVRDIVVIQQELEKLKHRKLGVVLKIETQRGFEKLPLLLLQAMQLPNPLGVMIARGDLAVECGWEKLADMQDEILSVCGAAHIPVIWATQVLESLVKSGLPTRAEITDVANGRKASCIMLNKGKYITGAVSTLDSILHNRSKKMRAEVKPLLLSKRLN